MKPKSLSPLLSGVILIALTISAAFITATTFSSVIQKQSQSKETHELSSCAVATLKLLSGTTSCSYSPLIDNSTVLYFSFDNDQDGYIEDLSGNGNTGYLYGNSRLILHFDEGSGKYFYDKTAYNNTGILGNDTGTSYNPTWITDNCISGSCLKFDGVDDYINISDSSSLDITDELTITAWVKPNSLDYGWIIDNGRLDIKGYGIFYSYNNDGAIKSYFANGTNHDERIIGYITDYSWHFIAWSFNNKTKEVKTYFDGELTGSYSTTIWIEPSTLNLFIGRYGGSGFYFNGTIDELAIYSRALTEEEIKALYQAQAQRAKFIEFVNSKHGKGIEFDGVDDYIQVADSPSLRMNNSLTIVAYVSLLGTMSPDGWEAIVRKYTGLGGYMLTFPYIASTSVDFYLRNGSTFISLSSPNELELKKWYFVTSTFDRPYAKLYINGEVVDEGIFDNTIEDPLTPLYIGYYSRYLNGTIDEVLIYNRSLSENEIKRTHILSLLVQNPSSTTIPDLQISVKIKNKYTNQTEIYINKTSIDLNPGEIKLLQIRIPEGEIQKIFVSSPCGVSVEYSPQEIGKNWRCG